MQPLSKAGEHIIPNVVDKKNEGKEIKKRRFISQPGMIVGALKI